MKFNTVTRRSAMLTLGVLLVACAKPNPDEVQLSADQVRTTFIGTPWHGPKGAFLFRPDGTYTYKRFDQEKPLGTWSYKMQPDGAITGATTVYTFYKSPNGYRYHHSRSDRFWPATPNQEPFL